MSDLKKVYKATTEQQASDNLEDFREKWSGKYPKIYESWKRNWGNLSTYFAYPPEIRKIIYTTNQIENFNRQLRKVSKAKSIFPNDDSLFKILYLATCDITRKWTGKRLGAGYLNRQQNYSTYFAFVKDKRLRRFPP
jgi:transposase-like protein